MNVYDMIRLSLDKDLAEKLDGDTNPELLVLVQMLRIMRGRPFKIELNGPGDATQGWTPDGKVWYPKEP